MNVQALIEATPKLNARDQAFALDLAASWKRRGDLSDKQMYWVKVLLDRASGAAPAEREQVDVGDFARVVALFKVARQQLKFPKISLVLNGAPVRLSVAGERSKAPGTINVTDGGSYGSNVWYGRVTPEGAFEKSAHATPGVVNLLRELAQAPAQVAQQYGRLTGHCCFCNAPLSDERSTAAGFGPVCADHYGLKAEWKAAQGVLETTAVAEAA